MTFAYPYLLLLLLLLLPLGWLLFYVRRKRPATFTLSTTKAFSGKAKSWRVRLSWLPVALLLLAFVFLVIALARPQTTIGQTKSSTEGIHIMLAIDISTSMLAVDLKPNRLEAAKEVASQFVMNRPYDNIGLVVFAAESFTQCPMTTDRATLINLLNGVGPGVIADGTAIGNGLATAVSRLKEVEAKSKVVILLTDGSNNSGQIAPITAAEIAETFGVTVYTIGVGTKGVAPYPVQTPLGIVYQDMPVDIDEPTLQKMAQITGGKYFRATDNKSLVAIYDEIDQMEKVKIHTTSYTQKEEYFMYFVLGALALMILSFVSRTTWLRVLP